MHATVIVELKPSVLDPQGKAIQHSLSSLGFGGVEDVRAGKLFRIVLADGEQSRDDVERQLRQMCERLLANTVIENFSYTLGEEAGAARPPRGTSPPIPDPRPGSSA